MHLYLVALHHVYVEINVVLLTQVGHFGDRHFGILEALFGIILLDELFGTRHDVGRNLLAVYHGQIVEQVFLLAAAHARKAQLGEARTLSEDDGEVSLVADDFIHLYLHARIDALAPETFGGVGDGRTRYLHALTHVKSGEAYGGIFVARIHTLHIDAADFVSARHGSVDDFGFHHRVGFFNVEILCLSR